MALENSPNEFSEASDDSKTSTANDSRIIIFALWLLVFSASSQLMIVVAMLPEIGKQLQVSDAKQGLLVSIYAVMVGVFALVIGPISDKIGRRKVLLTGTGLMTAALAMHAVVSDYTGLLIVRTLAGIAGGVLSGSAVSYVGDYFPYERRGWANGWVMSGIAAGQIAGVPLGALLANRFGFRSPFLIFAITMGATFLLILKRVPQPAVEMNANRLTIRRAFSDYLGLIKQKDIAIAALVFALLFFSMALYITYFPAWLTISQEATPNRIAALFFTGGVASVLTGPFVGKLSDTAGRKPLILASSLGLFLLMGGVTFIVREFWLAFPVFFISSILMAARMSPFQALLSALVPSNQRGALMSLTVSLGQIGFASGAALSGVVYAQYGYQASTFFGAAIVLFVAVLIWRFLPEPKLNKDK
ncbi:MAG: MFS transporter [Acidobacteriota bacterium]|nr:MFS transporter [Acidobacteriota bacterium]